MLIELGARMVVASLATKTATESRGDQSASTSVLAICVANVSEAYTRALGWCCEYTGADTGKVSYLINQEFVELVADPQMITALVALWQNGGFAKADLRTYLRKLGLIVPERTDMQIDNELVEQTENLGLDE
jgi:4-hydroxyphenylpyruvate dioxygenase-like putative hemolysin